MFILLPIFGDWAILALRLALGAIFIAHGFPKIKNLRGTGAWMSSVGFRPGIFWATVVAIAEFFGGLALIAGAYVRFAAAPLAIQFLVIIFWKLLKRMPFKEMEFDLLIFAATLALLTMGGGFYSVF